VSDFETVTIVFGFVEWVQTMLVLGTLVGWVQMWRDDVCELADQLLGLALGSGFVADCGGIGALGV